MLLCERTDGKAEHCMDASGDKVLKSSMHVLDMWSDTSATPAIFLPYCSSLCGCLAFFRHPLQAALGAIAHTTQSPKPHSTTGCISSIAIRAPCTTDLSPAQPTSLLSRIVLAAVRAGAWLTRPGSMGSLTWSRSTAATPSRQLASSFQQTVITSPCPGDIDERDKDVVRRSSGDCRMQALRDHNWGTVTFIWAGRMPEPGASLSLPGSCFTVAVL